MREYLFRGKSLDTGEWVYGYLAKAHWYTGDCDMTIIIPMDSTLYPRSEISGYEFVDSETVGQWTGLLDKNGVKIFEGDLLSINDSYTWSGHVMEVIFSNFSWECVTRTDDPQFKYYKHRLEFIPNKYYVLGNKWDNPELMN